MRACRKERMRRVAKCINRLPQPLALADPFSHSAQKVPRPPGFSGALVLFLGRPLNDQRLAASQAQTSLSLHSPGLNGGQYSHNTLSVPICQPRIVGQHSTVQLTSATVKLTYANFLPFLPVSLSSSLFSGERAEYGTTR